MLRRPLLLTCIATLAAAASPAAAIAAPGRTVFKSPTKKIPISNVDDAGAGPAVALPGGGAVMLVYDTSTAGVTAAAVDAHGVLDREFGEGGVVPINIPASINGQAQLLRQPDGRLLVVGLRPAASRLALPRLLIARLTPSGRLDPTFGGGSGIVEPGLEASCGGGCAPVALAPDGSIVVTGTAAASPADGIASSRRWVVVRLTPDGRLDPSFGAPAIGEPGTLNTGGYATVVRPDGRVVVLGTSHGAALVAGLTATGAPDPTFNGGRPLATPEDGLQLLLRPGGAIDLAGGTRLTRLTPSGALDTTYGSGGSVAFGGFTPGYGAPAMLATADGGTLLVGQHAFEPRPAAQPRLHVQRITPAGTLGAALDLTPAFGGGYASVLGRRPGRILQNSFRGTLVPRPDGSFLAVGSVSVVQYTGEGTGFSSGFVALAAYTPLLTADASFGGQYVVPQARVHLPRQRARSDYDLRRVLARVTVNGPGLVRLRVRDGRGRILAECVAPAYGLTGPVTVRIPLTATGRNVLRGGRSIRVRVGHDFRDLFTSRTRDAVTARLR